MTPLKRMRLIRDMEAPALHKAVLWALATRYNGKGECWPSLQQLCKDSGQSKATVCRVLNELAGDDENPGPVKRRQRFDNSTVYIDRVVEYTDVACLTQRPTLSHSETLTVKELDHHKQKPPEAVKPGFCNRCRKRPSLDQSGPCETCYSQEWSYERAVAESEGRDPSEVKYPGPAFGEGNGKAYD